MQNIYFNFTVLKTEVEKICKSIVMDNKNYDRPYIISPFYQTSTLKKKVVFSFSTCFEPANKFKINKRDN